MLKLGTSLSKLLELVSSVKADILLFRRKGQKHARFMDDALETRSII